VVAATGVDNLGVIAHLADASLVEIVDGPDGEPMVSMLETIRAYARDRLERSSEVHVVRLQHAQWCIHSAREVDALLHTPQQMRALDRMDVLEQDIRSALDWCLVPAGEGSAERRACGYALVQAMHRYWYRFGYAIEGRGWEERALLALESEGEKESSTLLDALHALGVSLLQQNELQAGTDMLRRALELARRLGDLESEARACNSLGIALREAGEIEAARSLIKESVVLGRRANSRMREATALSNMVLVHLDLGEYADALTAAKEALAADRELGDPWGISISESNLAGVLLVAEGPQKALEHLTRVAPQAIALGDRELSIDVVESFAAIWAALGDARRTAVLLGAADQHRAAAGIARSVPDEDFLQKFVSGPLASLPDQEREHLYARGYALGIDDAVALGREHPDNAARPAAGP
jgi:tetratricopeptide (TPR) repeat protein